MTASQNNTGPVARSVGLIATAHPFNLLTLCCSVCLFFCFFTINSICVMFLWEHSQFTWLVEVLKIYTCVSVGDSLTYHSGQKFSTFDKDQDSSSSNCAKSYLGGFWYKSCHYANPNGAYLWGADGTHRAVGVDWYHWKDYEYSLKTISMKIRPVQ